MASTTVARLILGIAFGLLLSIGAATVSTDEANAKPKRVQEQNDFVDSCRESGGTPRRIGPRTVRCTWPNGDTSECNFNTGACTTISTTAERSAGGQSTEHPSEPVTSEGPGVTDRSPDADSDATLDSGMQPLE